MLYTYIYMDLLNNKYNNLFAKLEKMRQENDNETTHIFQDKIYKKFITDVANGKFTTLKNAKKIANDINKFVIKHDKNMFYT